MVDQCRFVDTAEKSAIEQIADNREDFMRRWFAIAISVGFATTVVNMRWVGEGEWPTQSEWDQLCRLGVALIATILSWEGYLLSIKKKRLYEIARYFIDIFLVFLYLFLLLTSKYEHYWLFLHASAFLLYIAWDFLTVFWHRNWYNADGKSVWAAYGAGFLGRGQVDRGPVITITWFVAFAWLWVLSWADFPHETPILAVFVLIGLGGYRYNKGRYRENGWVIYLAPISIALLATSVVLGVQ